MRSRIGLKVHRNFLNRFLRAYDVSSAWRFHTPRGAEEQVLIGSTPELPQLVVTARPNESGRRVLVRHTESTSSKLLTEPQSLSSSVRAARKVATYLQTKFGEHSRKTALERFLRRVLPGGVAVAAPSPEVAIARGLPRPLRVQMDHSKKEYVVEWINCEDTRSVEWVGSFRTHERLGRRLRAVA